MKTDRARQPVIADERHPPRTVVYRLRSAGLAAMLMFARSGGAAAFPLLDTTEGPVPAGTELAAPDAQDLRHQLQLVNGLSAPAGGGWTIIPRIDLQEVLTDNVLQVHSPRRFDLATLVSPGIAIAGDLPRVRLNFDYAPILSLYARTGDLNALTQQMSGLGSVTLVPDLAFVDLRAVSGVNSLYGGIGGQGTVGAAGAFDTTQLNSSTLAGSGQGLNRYNEVQTSSFGISPYLMRRFGDWGTGRLGASADYTQSDSLSGFAAAPFPTGGRNAQTLFTTEQTAQFVSGDVLPYVQDAFDIDLVQSQTTVGAGVVNFQTGGSVPSTQRSTSSRALVSDKVTYPFNRTIAVFVSGGHEDITYSGSSFASAPSIHDLTWSFGTTLTPNPDSVLTVSYGHLNGFNSLSVDGHYAVTARTTVTVSYGTTLGTQLENVRNQLNLATVNGQGALVNGQNGGQLFGATNALAVRQGVYRTTTLTLGTQTSLDRDIVSLNLLLAKQTGAGGGNTANTSSKTASATWLHQVRPDVLTSASLSYSIQEQTAGAGFGDLGNSTSIIASLAWRWQISDRLSASARYSFLQRQSSNINFSIYQNLFILGISRSF